MERSIYLITGPCGAGKSTVGKLLAKHKSFERATFIEVDEIRRTVWQGYAPPFPDSPAAREQLELAARAAVRIARLYFEAGFWVFIGEVVEPWLQPVYRMDLEGCPTGILCLLPSEAEIEKRDRLREPSEQMGIRAIELTKLFQEWSEKANWTVLDPTDETPIQTAERIVSIIHNT
jgi:hypothetical protein